MPKMTDPELKFYAIDLSKQELSTLRQMSMLFSSYVMRQSVQNLLKAQAYAEQLHGLGALTKLSEQHMDFNLELMHAQKRMEAEKADMVQMAIAESCHAFLSLVMTFPRLLPSNEEMISDCTTMGISIHRYTSIHQLITGLLKDAKPQTEGELVREIEQRVPQVNMRSPGDVLQ